MEAESSPPTRLWVVLLCFCDRILLYSQVDVELAVWASWLWTWVDSVFVSSVLDLQLCIVKSSFLFCLLCFETESSLLTGWPWLYRFPASGSWEVGLQLLFGEAFIFSKDLLIKHAKAKFPNLEIIMFFFIERIHQAQAAAAKARKALQQKPKPPSKVVSYLVRVFTLKVLRWGMPAETLGFYLTQWVHQEPSWCLR